MALPLMVSVDAESIDLEFPSLLMYLPGMVRFVWAFCC